MLTYSMILAPLQSGEKIGRRSSGAIKPTTLGETALCENLRERVAGRLEAVGLPSTVTNLSAAPVALDSRGNNTYLFTQNLSGTLFLEGFLQDDKSFVAKQEELATIDSQVKSSAVCGEFLIFLLADGSLWYMLWNDDTLAYSSLGRMPAMPVITARRTGEVEHTATVDAIEFDDVAADLRSDIPDAIEKAVSKEVTTAWQSAVDSAHVDGRWTQPVAVRFAVRLWDGRILYVSQPQIVMPDGGYQATSRILIPLVSTDAGFIGTQAVSLSLQSFKIEVGIDDWNTSGWENVVRGIEVWVSSPQEVIDEAGSVSLSQYTTSSVNYLSAFMPVTSVDVLANSLADTSYYRHSLIPLSSASSATLSYSAPAEKKIVDVSEVSPADLLSLRVGNFLGHGGFLHLADVSRSLEAPFVFPAAEDAGQTSSFPCIVSVTLASQSGEARVVRQTTLPAARVAPLLYYPSRDATQIDILVQCDDGVHHAVFPLSPLSSDEDAAVCISPSLAAFDIPLDENAEFVVPEQLNTTRRMPSTIITSKRGNPFVEADRTESAGGEIFTLAPQTAGGGAYTRQFIYLFTSKGIIALTHKSTGEHTNCRVIASDVVNTGECVCPTADGVYAMSRSGDLLRLNDARRITIFSALSGCKALAWNRSTNELWLIPYPTTRSDSWCRSIVVQISKNFRVWLSSAIPEKLLSADGNPFYVQSYFPAVAVADDVATQVDVTAIYTGQLKSITTESEPVGNQLWESAPMPNDKRGLVVGRIGIFGDDVDAKVAVETVAEGIYTKSLSADYEAVTLDSIQLTGSFVSPVETHFLLGAFPTDISPTSCRHTATRNINPNSFLSKSGVNAQSRQLKSSAKKRGNSVATTLSPFVSAPPCLRFTITGFIPTLTAISLF